MREHRIQIGKKLFFYQIYHSNVLELVFAMKHCFFRRHFSCVDIPFLFVLMLEVNNVMICMRVWADDDDDDGVFFLFSFEEHYIEKYVSECV